MPKHDETASPAAEVSNSDSWALPSTPEDLRLLQAAADADSPDAQYFLGLLYEEGNNALGISPDEDIAIRWLYLSAIKGHREAQFSLAYRMHSQLLFVWPTPAYFSSDEVIRWYKAAAAQGHAEAAFQLHLEFSAELEPGDDEQARHWLGVAVSLGYDPTFQSLDNDSD